MPSSPRSLRLVLSIPGGRVATSKLASYVRKRVEKRGLTAVWDALNSTPEDEAWVFDRWLIVRRRW